MKYLLLGILGFSVSMKYRCEFHSPKILTLFPPKVSFEVSTEAMPIQVDSRYRRKHVIDFIGSLWEQQILHHLFDKLTTVFYASVLLLIINLVTTL